MDQGTQTMNEDDQPKEEVPLPSENVPQAEVALINVGSIGHTTKRNKVNKSG